MEKLNFLGRELAVYHVSTVHTSGVLNVSWRFVLKDRTLVLSSPGIRLKKSPDAPKRGPRNLPVKVESIDREFWKDFCFCRPDERWEKKVESARALAVANPGLQVEPHMVNAPLEFEYEALFGDGSRTPVLKREEPHTLEEEDLCVQKDKPAEQDTGRTANAPQLYEIRGPDDEVLFRAYEDFRTVIVRGVTYSFTTNQAIVVEELYNAYIDGLRERHQDSLNIRLGDRTSYQRSSARLRDLFKNHGAWGKVIVPGNNRGTFRLYID